MDCKLKFTVILIWRLLLPACHMNKIGLYIDGKRWSKGDNMIIRAQNWIADSLTVSLTNRLNQSAFFKRYRFTLFPKDPLSRLFIV